MMAVKEFVEREHLLREGETVVLGVSGGADSICLFHVMKELAKRYQLRLVVVHVHHGIRGAEADRDAGFVEELCKNEGVEFYLKKEDVPALAQARGESLEEAGRNLRYETFLQVARKYQATTIAVAHHANDQAETVMMNILRGSSLRGGMGMKPSRKLQECHIIRPLLMLTREEIEAYLTKGGYDYCKDSTNDEMDYLRNKLRNLAIPFLTREINERSVEHINALAKDLGEAMEYIQMEAKRRMEDLVWKENDRVLRMDDGVKKLPAALRHEIIYQSIAIIRGGMKDVTSAHIEAVDELLVREVSKEVSLPGGMRALRTYTGVELFLEKEEALNVLQLGEKNKAFAVNLGLTGEKVHTQIIPVEDVEENFVENSSNDYTKILDYDKIKFGFSWRKREGGDYISLENGGHKSLKQYFIDEKIPLAMRDEVLLLAEEHHILWVVGGRISADVKVDPSTKTLLKVWVDR